VSDATGHEHPAHGQAAQKRYLLGTHRTRKPAETLARVRPLLPELGITRIANVTGLDRTGIPVVMVTRPNSRSMAVFQGKGLTLEAAKASGVMEALEVWHAERILNPLKLASYDELRKEHRVVDPATLPLSRRGSFDGKATLLWIEGTDLLGAGALWIPYELVSTDYTVPLPPGSGCFQANSNGLASGNHWLEAVSHGLCEVVERDARTLWELSSPGEQARRVLDLASVDDPDCRSLLERIRAADLDMRVWDCTSDIGIATFVCQLMDPAGDHADPEVGSGCHPAREIALLRALTEAAQARVTYIAGARDDFLLDHYSESSRAGRRAAMAERMSAGAEPRAFAQAPSFESQAIDDDLRWMLARLRAAGIDQAIAVDLTRQSIGIPVARIVVPGLEGALKYGDADYAQGMRARRGRRSPV
jgi:ribosomal protein S12 methylthiotransferase accessory factor